MRILLVNDDGIAADGIIRLARAAVRFGEVWVAAPDRQCSAMSQHITLRDSIPFAEVPFPVPEVKGAFRIGGTPADCVRAARSALLPGRPDYVFSGINDGRNAGFNIAYSGTIAAAMESLMGGTPAIAFSTAQGGNTGAEQRFLSEIMEELLKKPCAKNEIWNVNFPSCDAGDCRGVRWGQKIAQMQDFTEELTKTAADGGCTLLESGRPADLQAAPEGTDLRAITDRFVSVGTVRCMVM